MEFRPGSTSAKKRNGGPGAGPHYRFRHLSSNLHLCLFGKACFYAWEPVIRMFALHMGCLRSLILRYLIEDTVNWDDLHVVYFLARNFVCIREVSKKYHANGIKWNVSDENETQSNKSVKNGDGGQLRLGRFPSLYLDSTFHFSDLNIHEFFKSKNVYSCKKIHH